MNENFTKILDLAIKHKASDIHFQTGKRPILRINGELANISDAVNFELKDDLSDLDEYMNKDQHEYYDKNGNVDFGFTYNEDYRFRANVYRQQMGISLSLRLIGNAILDFEALNAPNVFKKIAENYRQGFFLMVGPTGMGKSTSLAAILNHINKNRELHIITIEDPIEYLFQNEKCIIEQREIGVHASSFSNALRACMRQDPDVIMVGEMRDYETMQAAVTLAETGHLVFSTMHTNNAAQTIDRIIDNFPEHKQKQVRMQLADTLSGIVSQRLIRGIDGKLVLAYEQLLATDAIRNIIRTEKSEQIYNAIQPDQNSDEASIFRLEQCLAKLIKEEKITKETALEYATSKELIDIFMDYNN